MLACFFLYSLNGRRRQITGGVCRFKQEQELLVIFEMIV